MNSNPRGAVLVHTNPALASKTPVYGSGATVACACRCSNIAFQVEFTRNLTNAQTKVKTVQDRQTLTVVNGGYFGGDTDRIDCETALLVPVSRYVVNRACFGVETDQIDCETTLPVLVHNESRLLWC